MKKNFIVLVVITLFIVSASAQSSNTPKNNPAGTWKFEAPYAPEGYTTGTIVITFVDQKTATTMSFTGSEYKLPGEKVKTPGDSVLFSIYLEGQDIKVLLKLESETKMTGKAVYSEGEVPLILTRVLAEETDVKK
jgi:hypothetical protein